MFQTTNQIMIDIVDIPFGTLHDHSWLSFIIIHDYPLYSQLKIMILHCQRISMYGIFTYIDP